MFPAMVQKGLEMVRIACGSPGNLCLYLNNLFHIDKSNLFPLLFITPIIPAIQWIGKENEVDWIGVEERRGD